MLNRDNVIADLKTKFNDIGIIGGGDLCRLIGFYEDDMDCYYHILYMNGHNINSNRNDQYFTMVGNFYSLKGVIDEEEYTHLENTFSLNGSPRATEFIIGRD